MNEKIRVAKHQLASIGVKIYQKDVVSVVNFGEIPSADPDFGFVINHKKVLMNDGGVHEYDWIYTGPDGEPSPYSARGVAKNHRYTPAG